MFFFLRFELAGRNSSTAVGKYFIISSSRDCLNAISQDLKGECKSWASFAIHLNASSSGLRNNLLFRLFLGIGSLFFLHKRTFSTFWIMNNWRIVPRKRATHCISHKARGLWRNFGWCRTVQSDGFLLSAAAAHVDVNRFPQIDKVPTQLLLHQTKSEN